jgi:hypothetical protein
LTEARGVRLVAMLLGEGWSDEILRFLAGGSPFVESGRKNAGGRKGFIVYAAERLLAFRWRGKYRESDRRIVVADVEVARGRVLEVAKTR